MKLAEVCRIVGGGTPSKKNKTYYSGNIPWASVRDMNNPILTSTEFRISDEAVRESATNVIPAGEVIISTHVGLGKVCILAQDTAINQDLKAVIPTVDIDRRYLYHWFVSQAPKLVAAGKGATVKGVTVKFVLDLDIPIPSRNSQQSIAKQLSLVLECVKKRQAQFARLDALAKSLFVEMFGDPVENPKKWMMSQMSSVITHSNNGLSRRGKVASGHIVLRLVEVQDGFIDYSSPNRMKLSVAEMQKYRLFPGDFLFARVNGNPANVGRCAMFQDVGEPVFHNDHIIRVRLDQTKIIGPFASALLNSAFGKNQIRSKIKSSAGQYTVNQEDIGNISVILPSLDLQELFASRVEAIDKSKFAIRKSLDELNRLYRSLLQQYFG